jgi:hypothetical protein
MGETFQETTVPFPVGASIRDLFNQPMMASFRLEEVACVLLSPRRLGDVLSYLHKPPAKPIPPDQVPVSAIFRGMVFGSVGIYTHKNVESANALVLSRASSPAPAAAAPPVPTFDPTAEPAPAAPGPAPSPAPKVKSPMVGLGARREAAPPPAAPAPPSAADRPMAESLPYFSGNPPAPRDKSPSEEKLRRWTELIPSDTRIRKPKYPGLAPEGAPAPATAPAPAPKQATAPRQAPSSKPAPAPAPSPLPEPEPEEAVSLPVEASPPDLASKDRLRLAKEADRLLQAIIGAVEVVVRLSPEDRTDLVLEMRMLQLELDKYKPSVVRVTEMLMNVSGVVEIRPTIARLKECLRGLGLLL